VPTDDKPKTPAELTVAFLADLQAALQTGSFSTNDRMAIIVQTAPAVAAYYLKGQ